ncbi:RHS repeat-associated core domain-containing protein [Streptomyces mirabilis]|uniref:RHS repeat-associated core domain-containing protein n=1 Tax=Streptomyces mirabilis TaxID=68239 RepID=UPI0036CCA65F
MTDGSGTPVNAVRTYSQNGAPTVVRTTNGSTTGHKLSCLITDQLGTASIAVDLGKDQTVTRRAFKPYGETRGTKPSSWPNQHTYLGVGIDDTNTGLTHLGAREYDQNTGRFVSADPVFDVADPLQMNGYAYANNNPVTRSDPTGLESCGPSNYSCTKDTIDTINKGGGGTGDGSTNNDNKGKDKQGKTVVRNEGKSNVGTACSGAAMGAMRNPHDIAVCKTGQAALEWAKAHNVDGYVTVDIGEGSKTFNHIPEGHRKKQDGSDGEADVILWAKGRVYIWEVKPNPGKGKDDTYAFRDGPDQLTNYVNKLTKYLRSEGDTRAVQRGPSVARKEFTWTRYRGAVWSKKEYQGMRYYGLYDDDDDEPTPQPSPGPTDLQRPMRTPTAEPTPSATGTYGPGSPDSDYSGEAVVVSGGVTIFSISMAVGSVLSKGPACLLGGMC